MPSMQKSMDWPSVRRSVVYENKEWIRTMYFWSTAPVLFSFLSITGFQFVGIELGRRWVDKAFGAVTLPFTALITAAAVCAVTVVAAGTWISLPAQVVYRYHHPKQPLTLAECAVPLTVSGESNREGAKTPVSAVPRSASVHQLYAPASLVTVPASSTAASLESPPTVLSARGGSITPQ